MPTNRFPVRHFFFTAIAAIRLPLQHVKELSRTKLAAKIHPLFYLSILLYHFNIYLTYQCQYVAHIISYITTMNIKQLQHNLNYKLYSTGTPSIQANNFTLFIEVKIMEQTL